MNLWFFTYYLIVYEQKMPQIKQKLKVKIKDGPEAPWNMNKSLKWDIN